MRRNTKQMLSICLSLALVASSFSTASFVSQAKAKLTKTKLTMKVGESKRITIKGKVAKAKYSFRSSSKKKATVSSRGVVKAKKTGKVVITVKEKIKKKTRRVGKVTVTIKKKSGSVSTSNGTSTATPGSTNAVTVTEKPTQEPTATATATATPKPTRKPTPTPYPENPEFNDIPSGYAQKKADNVGTLKRFEYETNVYYDPAVKDEEKETITRYAMVVLPKGYTKEKKYPVVYFLHGYGDIPEFMVGDGKSNEGNGDQYVIWNEIANKDCKDVIVVYSCTSCNKVIEKGWDKNSTPSYDYVINDVTGPLMSAVNKEYSTLTGRENTAICGFSMGGRESFNIAFRRPDLFGAVGGFCPAPGAFDGGDMLTKDELQLSDEYKNSTYIQITKGAKDTMVQNTPVEYDNLFTQKGIPHKYYETMGGDPPGKGNGTHWKHVWQHGLYNFLKRAFPVEEEAQ